MQRKFYSPYRQFDLSREPNYKGISSFERATVWLYKEWQRLSEHMSGYGKKKYYFMKGNKARLLVLFILDQMYCL